MTRTTVGRLARAVHLNAERIDAETWRVSGGEHPHFVTTAGCDCADAAFRPGFACKHVLAVRLRSGDAETLSGLRAIVPKEAR